MQYPITSVGAEQLLSLLCFVVLLSLLVERALAVLFESRAANEWLSKRSLKEPIAVAASLGVCMRWDIDVITALVEGAGGRSDSWGQLLTASIVAGGSKASIKLFRDVLGVMSNAERKRVLDKPQAPDAGASSTSLPASST